MCERGVCGLAPSTDWRERGLTRAVRDRLAPSTDWRAGRGIAPGSDVLFRNIIPVVIYEETDVPKIGGCLVRSHWVPPRSAGVQRGVVTSNSTEHLFPSLIIYLGTFDNIRFSIITRSCYFLEIISRLQRRQRSKMIGERRLEATLLCVISSIFIGY